MNEKKLLIAALQAITKVDEGSPVLTYQRMEAIAREALLKVKEGSHD